MGMYDNIRLPGIPEMLQTKDLDRDLYTYEVDENLRIIHPCAETDPASENELQTYKTFTGILTAIGTRRKPDALPGSKDSNDWYYFEPAVRVNNGVLCLPVFESYAALIEYENSNKA